MKQKTLAFAGLTSIFTLGTFLCGAPALAQDNAYENLHTRYAAERAAVHRGAWPERYVNWTKLDIGDDNLVHQHFAALDYSHPGMVQYPPTGEVKEIERATDGHIEAVQVHLYSGKDVWIDQPDLRFDVGNQLLFTNIDRADLDKMADEHL